MLDRRQFFLSGASLVGVAVIAPFYSFTSLAQTDPNSVLTKDKYSALMKKWISLYDNNGGYITEIKLVKIFEQNSNAQLEQFSLRWKIRNDSLLAPGTYVLEDFSNTPTAIYLEPSFSKRNNGKYYRASFSLLRN
jgi:hypothetical protein